MIPRPRKHKKRPCDICGAQFIPNVIHALRCSQECRDESRRLRQIVYGANRKARQRHEELPLEPRVPGLPCGMGEWEAVANYELRMEGKR